MVDTSTEAVELLFQIEERRPSAYECSTETWTPDSIRATWDGCTAKTTLVIALLEKCEALAAERDALRAAICPTWQAQQFSVTALCALAEAHRADSDGVDTYEDERDALRDLAERLKSEAQIHAQEARTQRATVHECYQAVGAQKGDWNGAAPVREAVDALRAQLADLGDKLDRALTAADSWMQTAQEQQGLRTKEDAEHRSQLAMMKLALDEESGYVLFHRREAEQLRSQLAAAKAETWREACLYARDQEFISSLASYRAVYHRVADYCEAQAKAAEEGK